MNAAAAHKGHDHFLDEQARETARFSIRRRMNEHPMVMFATVVGAAFVAMAFHPTAGGALASAERAAPRIEIAQAAPKGPRLNLQSDVDNACSGQSWGAESVECLAVIAREAGRDETRKVRMIASAEMDRAETPNVF